MPKYPNSDAEIVAVLKEFYNRTPMANEIVTLRKKLESHGSKLSALQKERDELEKDRDYHSEWRRKNLASANEYERLWHDECVKASGYASRLDAERSLLEAFKAVPLYVTDRNWSSDEEGDTVEICNGCGFPGVGDHDGNEDCPVARVERLLAGAVERRSELGLTAAEDAELERRLEAPVVETAPSTNSGPISSELVVEIPVEIPDADATCEHGKRLGELCEPCGDDDDTPLV